MDPYIERPEIWRDFHDSLITFIRGELQPALRPRYVAVVQERMYVQASERDVWPDVALVRTALRRGRRPANGTGGAVLEAGDEPAVFELQREEICEPYIQIVEPAAGNRIVTAIEVLSPTNKTLGAGRDSYIQKREELLRGGASFVEIDLLRDGHAAARVSSARRARLKPGHYLIAVTRQTPPRLEVYSIPLKRRLPRVAIPLDAGVPDVRLELQAAFTRCWDEGPYPELLRYDGVPPGKLAGDEAAWCRKLARRA